MNIEICKRCSRFPDYFKISSFSNHVLLTGMQVSNKPFYIEIGSGCNCIVNEEFFFNYRRLPSTVDVEELSKIKNEYCPYKFEHEVTE